MNHHILLTIDVEDWFQVENFKPWIPFSSWSSHEIRVERNTQRILDLFDSVKLRPSAMLAPNRPKPPSFGNHALGSSCNPRATFFVLGWIAKRNPRLVREIHARGHEVASHGYHHTLCMEETAENLRKDLTDTKKLLEDILGAPVFGYRAPSFSISDDVLKIIADCGYLYDSSYNSFAMHGRYGHTDLSQNGKRGIALQISKNLSPDSVGKPEVRKPKTETFFELPISNLTVRNPFSYKLTAHSSQQNTGGFVVPWGGGAYFRLLPVLFFKMGVRSILQKQGAYLFYVHPWEIDPQQPRVLHAPPLRKLRHYVNLTRTHSKLCAFLKAFSHCCFPTCFRYLKQIGPDSHVADPHQENNLPQMT